MELNKQQQKIIQSNSHHKIILAGAGTGKTATLTAAAESVKDKRVALITFTNEAADEIRQRLSFEPAFIGTIHRFAFSIARWLSIQQGTRLNLMYPGQINTVVNYLMDGMEFSHNEIIDCSKYLNNKRSYLLENPHPPYYYNKVDEDYITYKRKTNSYDILDTPLYLLEKLKYNSIILNFDYLFVDEGQDLSPDQYELILKLPITNKLIIGDPKQSIYIFRGADGQVFEKFKQQGYDFFTLDTNYRSRQEILDYAESGLIAAKGNGGIIYKRCGDLLEKYPQILCRSNQDVQAIQRYYDKVTTIHAAKGLEYPYVLIVSFEEDTDEEKNIMYVAKTRAEEGLGIFSLQTVINNLKK